jgi:hypothetical protein
MLVIKAPARYPSINFLGLGRSNMTVVAATRVGLSEAVNDRAIT